MAVFGFPNIFFQKLLWEIELHIFDTFGIFHGRGKLSRIDEGAAIAALARGHRERRTVATTTTLSNGRWKKPRRRRRKRTPAVTIWAWIVAANIVCTYMMHALSHKF